MSGEQRDIFLSLSRKSHRTPALGMGSYLMSAVGFCDIHPSPSPLPSAPFSSPRLLVSFSSVWRQGPVCSLKPAIHLLQSSECWGLLECVTIPGIYLDFFFSALSIWDPFILGSSEAEVFAESLAPGTLLLGSVVQDPILHGLPLLCLSQYSVCLSCLFDTSCHQQPA